MKFKTVPLMPDLKFSAVGFGCWGISGGDFWNNTTDEASIRTIQKAADLGINFFDVAPVYGMGHAEEILGKALKGRRGSVLIASKCGIVWDDQKNIAFDLSPANVHREIDESLRRLQTDHLDLYQLHWPDPNTPIEETMSALLKIKKSGKIRHIGVSNFSVDLTRQAMDTGAVASHQGLYNMLERNPDSYHNIPLDYRMADEVLPFCAESGLAFFPYSPLFQGLLTDTFKLEGNFDQNDVRASNPKLVGDTFKTYYEIVEKLKNLARKIDKPLSQIAINWLVNQAEVTSVICGGQTPQHIEENAASITWELTEEMLNQIDEIIAPYQQAGIV